MKYLMSKESGIWQRLFWPVLVIVFAVFIFALKIVPAAYFDYNIWYALDDAYIYHQFALNLSKGYFLTYSIGEPYTNGCSSFLYYLLYGLFIVILKPLFSGDVLFKAIQIVMMTVNFILYVSTVYFAKKILDELLPKGRFWLFYLFIISIFSVNIILYSCFSGLEVALTMFLVTTIAYYFITKNYSLLFIVMILANVNRPENIVLSVLMLVYLYYRLLFKKIVFGRFQILLFIGAQLSLLVIPLVNFAYLGTIWLSSSARVAPLFGKYFLLGTIYYLAKDPTFILSILFSPFQMPGSFWDSWCLMRTIISVVLIILLCALLFKNYNKKIIREKHVLIVFVILSYLLLPILLRGALGEWGRYIVPILPLIIILIYSLTEQINAKLAYLIAKLLLVINLTLFPLWVVYSYDYLCLLNKLMLPMANYLEKHMPTSVRIGVDQAGLLAIKNPGTSIDVYGLGTQRYAKVHGKFDKVYGLIRRDRLDYFITWPSQEKIYYLDSAHYKAAYKGTAKIVKVFSTNFEGMLFDPAFPKEWILYKVVYH